jgi:DNA polymerase-3 subunit delta
MASELKPAYLIHGSDHGAVGERRAGLRALAESEGSACALEVLEGEDATPAGVALALRTLTIAIARRVLIVDGVERWKEAEVEEQLVGALAEMPPETTVALFAREEARAKAPAALHKAVKAAGGQIVAQGTVKPWELPAWVREQGARMGLALDGDAAKGLIGAVGERQQRLLRELEKLALELDARAGEDPVRIGAEDVESRVTPASAWRAYALADALVGGDRREATFIYLRLRAQGERLAGLVYLIAGRLREALAVSSDLEAGRPAAEIKRSLRMPSRAADRFIKSVSGTDPERLRTALAILGDLELDTRGGSPVEGWRSRTANLREETLALRAIEAMTA